LSEEFGKIIYWFIMSHQHLHWVVWGRWTEHGRLRVLQVAKKIL
jgi:hypothetical protein